MSNKTFHYQHIHSSVLDKAPTSGQIQTAEIAVNSNAEKPQLFIKDSSGDVRSFYSDYVVNLTQAEYDALVSAGTVDERILYVISDASPIDVSKYVSSGSVDTTASTSAYTLSFSGDNGSLFDLEIPKGGDGKPILEGTDIKIVSGETADTIYVSADTVIDSASTRVVQSKTIYEALSGKVDIDDIVQEITSASTSGEVPSAKVTYEELDKKLDKANFVSKLYPKGSIYVTYENKNPSEWLGGTWELIGGEDANKVYYPAYAISTDTAGTEVSESLPNITGKFSAYDYVGGWHDGATSTRQTLNPSANAGGSETPWIGYTFNASTSSSVYQDGAHVNVNAIKIFFWKKVSDGEVVEVFTPLEVDVTDVLFTGSVGGGTAEVTLSNNFEGYKTLKITFLAATSWVMVRYIDTTDIKPRYLFDLNWANDAYRYCYFQGSQPSSGNKLLIDATSDVYITKVEGLKPVPTTNITAGQGIKIDGSEISSTVTFKNYYVNINMTTQGNFNGTITCDSGFVPLGLGSTSIRTDGAVGYGYCDNIVKVSDTQYRFSGWANPNGTSGSGASSITIYATFVKNGTVLNNY